MSQVITFDYHSHHRRCGHARGEMSEYVDAAIALGMTEFGVSDHGPAYWLPGDHARPQTQMAIREFPSYVADARALRERYGDRISVRAGVEADYIEDHEADLLSLITSHPLDYMLGSVHFTRGRNIFERRRWEEEDAEETYADYYRLVAKAARSGLFDVLSHLTAVEAFGPPLSETLAARVYPPAADAVAESGCLVEINTSGYRKMNGDEPFPNRRMLRLLIERGVPLTFGADSHTPAEVGFGRDRVAALLRELGVADAPIPVTSPRGAELCAFSTVRS